MRKKVYAVRLDARSELALNAAAISKQIKPRTLAQQFIDDGLMRAGYLPKPRRTQATTQA